MTQMKHIIYLTLAAMLTVATLQGCSDADNAWDSLPPLISRFLAMYYPEQGVTKYVEDDSAYYVDLKDSASLIFNASQEWTSVNGNGGTLPQMFLFDQLPPALYAWLQENEAVDGVYRATRTASVYELTLAGDIVDYSIDTGLITYPYR